MIILYVFLNKEYCEEPKMNKSFLFSNAIQKNSLIVNYQSVRWRRPKKPFWLGLAKSKMFVIRQPKMIPLPEEKQTWVSLKFAYNTEYKSLLNFICNENPRLQEIATADEGKSIMSQGLQEEISMSLKVNDEFNAESKRLGEEWMEKFIAQEIEKAEQLISQNEKNKLIQQKLIDEIVRKEKALSVNYITPENIDEAIENCLKTVAEFDFAIDLQGNKYYGRETLKKQEIPTGMQKSAVLDKENKEITQNG